MPNVFNFPVDNLFFKYFLTFFRFGASPIIFSKIVSFTLRILNATFGQIWLRWFLKRIHLKEFPIQYEVK